MLNIGKQHARNILKGLRRRGKRNLFWWQGPPYNAGDWVGPFLFKAITGQEPRHRTPSNRSTSTVFLTVGSLTRWICEDSIVWGSGLLDRDETFWQPYETYAVRGPYTRERFLELGYPCPPVFGDPAILLPRFYHPTSAIRYRIGIVPHYSAIDDAKTLYEGDAEIHVIDIREPLEAVITQILSCGHIASSSLHGLIFAHSYGVPAALIEFSKKAGGDGVKFLDYYGSGGVQSVPQSLYVDRKVPVLALEQYIESIPQPNLAPLIEPLLDACPFNPREAVD